MILGIDAIALIYESLSHEERAAVSKVASANNVYIYHVESEKYARIWQDALEQLGFLHEVTAQTDLLAEEYDYIMQSQDLVRGNRQ